LFLNEPISANLDLLAKKRGESKAVLTREALREYLKKHHLDPDQIPIIDYKHHYPKS
jgi:hypothetical protein